MLSPYAHHHFYNDDQWNRVPLSPPDSNVDDLPEGAFHESGGQHGSHEANGNGSPPPSHQSTLKEQVVDSLHLVKASMAQTVTHSPSPRPLVVEETMVEYPPNNDSISM